jgi:hypothetical protein
MPAANIVIAIRGRVSSSRDRRPQVSMVHIAGNAPKQLIKPKIQEASRAPNVEKPASEKICRVNDKAASAFFGLSISRQIGPQAEIRTVEE